jgi:hypothetical protein
LFELLVPFINNRKDEITLQVHLNKSGGGMASKRLAAWHAPDVYQLGWVQNQETRRCINEQSKRFEVNIRMDLAKWGVEATDAWMAQDDAIIAAHKAKK